MNRKLIAILRGVTPEDAAEVARVIIEGGIDWLEITSNSPDYLDSIKQVNEMVRLFPHSKIGAGTITTVSQVEKVKQSGGSFVVSPNTNPEVIRHTKKLGLISMPGCFTPTEAFTALENGADILKLFPTDWYGNPEQAMKHLKAVLPRDTRVYAVGGVGHNDYPKLLRAGFDGLGIGSDLYKPGCDLKELREKVNRIVKSYDQAVKALVEK